ncbi:MAG TPA: ribonuclease HI family protein [bacterium]|nr:ribonuclease HI family protein [bacterium]
MKKLTVFIDGASRGNPGNASIGIVIYENGNLLMEKGEYIGVGTNNIAEYMALIYSLIECIKLKAKNIEIKSDSLLLVKQIKGEYKVKNEFIKKLNIIANKLIENFNTFEIKYIPREENKKADKIASEILSYNSLFPSS